jgi:hypothetical protein
VENLIFVLHFQSFYFLPGSLALLIAAGAAAIFPSASGTIASSPDVVLYAWAAVYLFTPTVGSMASAHSRPS